ncbi:radical SAM protein, partial [bacterium]|nr:radical SAM protein [bacterium]
MADFSAKLKAPVYVCLLTYGCQMNILDSQILSGSLARQGFVVTEDETAADVVLFITCSVRDLAERKVLGKAGKLNVKRNRRPEVVLGVTGCMAELKGEALIGGKNVFDFVAGTHKRHLIPELILRALCKRVAAAEVTSVNAEALERLGIALAPYMDECLPAEGKLFAVGRDEAEARLDELEAMRPRPWQAFVEIMRGCSNFCSYCVVPYARGPEVSRPADEILAELRTLASSGCVE